MDAIELVWEPLTGNDGKLTLTALQWAYSQGLIDRRTALMLAPIDIGDVEAVLSAVDDDKAKEWEDRHQQFAANNRREEQLALEAGDDGG